VPVRWSGRGRIIVTLPPFRPSRSAVTVLALLACPAAALAAEAPHANFSLWPDDPPAGHPVEFLSTSCDPDGRLVRQAWDLDGDGAFDDAFGADARRIYPRRGTRTIGLEVTAANGQTATRRKTLMVQTEYALARPRVERVMTPSPVVRLAGRITRAGARIRVLSVSRAPVCAVVRVSCRGRSCQARRRTVRFKGRVALRFRRFERRLRAGTVLTVRVSKGDTIGKLTRFKIRRGRTPARSDRCLRPGASKGSACPEE
jgi:PKD repeat protein